MHTQSDTHMRSVRLMFAIKVGAKLVLAVKALRQMCALGTQAFEYNPRERLRLAGPTLTGLGVARGVGVYPCP